MASQNNLLRSKGHSSGQAARLSLLIPAPLARSDLFPAVYCFLLSFLGKRIGGAYFPLRIQQLGFFFKRPFFFLAAIDGAPPPPFPVLNKGDTPIPDERLVPFSDPLPFPLEGRFSPSSYHDDSAWRPGVCSEIPAFMLPLFL